MEAVVLHRVAFLEYFCLKHFSDRNMGQVTPPPRDLGAKQRYELNNGHSPAKTAILHSAPRGVSKGTEGGAVFIGTPIFIIWESTLPGVLPSIKSVKSLLMTTNFQTFRRFNESGRSDRLVT